MATTDADAVPGSDGLGRADVALPDDIPSESALVRSIFGEYDTGDALELIDGDRALYIMPWCARQNGVAGYEQTLGTFEARPVEFPEAKVRRLLEDHRPRPVGLRETPAWLLEERDAGAAYVTWHARVRWGERVEAMPDPGPAIRDAFETGVSIGTDSRGQARYYAPADVVLTYVYRRSTPVVTTVYHPEDVQELGSEHLTECPHCEELYDPGNQQGCHCCGGPVCPWCTESVA